MYGWVFNKDSDKDFNNDVNKDYNKDLFLYGFWQRFVLVRICSMMLTRHFPQGAL